MISNKHIKLYSKLICTLSFSIIITNLMSSRPNRYSDVIKRTLWVLFLIAINMLLCNYLLPWSLNTYVNWCLRLNATWCCSAYRYGKGTAARRHLQFFIPSFTPIFLCSKLCIKIVGRSYVEIQRRWEVICLEK